MHNTCNNLRFRLNKLCPVLSREKKYFCLFDTVFHFNLVEFCSIMAVDSVTENIVKGIIVAHSRTGITLQELAGKCF